MRGWIQGRPGWTWKHCNIVSKLCQGWVGLKFWGRVGVMLGSCWGRVGVMSGSCWGHIETVLGLCWGRVGVVLQGRTWGRPGHPAGSAPGQRQRCRWWASEQPGPQQQPIGQLCLWSVPVEQPTSSRAAAGGCRLGSPPGGPAAPTALGGGLRLHTHPPHMATGIMCLGGGGGSVGWGVMQNSRLCDSCAAPSVMRRRYASPFQPFKTISLEISQNACGGCSESAFHMGSLLNSQTLHSEFELECMT